MKVLRPFTKVEYALEERITPGRFTTDKVLR